MIHPQAQEARIDFVVDIDQDYLAKLKFELPTIVNSTNCQEGVKVNDFVIDIVSIGSDTRIDYVSRVSKFSCAYLLKRCTLLSNY